MVDMVTLPNKMIKYHFSRGENPSLFCKNKLVRFQKNIKNTNWFDYHNIIKQKDNLMVDMVTLPNKMIKYHFERGENPSLLQKQIGSITTI